MDQVKWFRRKAYRALDKRDMVQHDIMISKGRLDDEDRMLIEKWEKLSCYYNNKADSLLKNKNQEKWYYEITDKDTGDWFYASVSMPVKEEKLCEFIGLSDKFSAREITAQEYKRNT